MLPITSYRLLKKKKKIHQKDIRTQLWHTVQIRKWAINCLSWMRTFFVSFLRKRWILCYGPSTPTGQRSLLRINFPPMIKVHTYFNQQSLLFILEFNVFTFYLLVISAMIFFRSHSLHNSCSWFILI